MPESRPRTQGISYAAADALLGMAWVGRLVDAGCMGHLNDRAGLWVSESFIRKLDSLKAALRPLDPPEVPHAP